MNRFVSLLAVALVSSLFAAGCGKLKNCADAKTPADCKKEKFEEGAFTCEWKKATDDAKAETCVDVWAASDEVKGICEAATDQGACDKATPEAAKKDANARCSWEKPEGADKETKETCVAKKK